jgi:hypothetical protein
MGFFSWFANVIASFFTQKLHPYYLSLYTVELFTLSIPIIPLLFFFIVFFILHYACMKWSKKSPRVCLNVLYYTRNTFYVLLVLFGGILLAFIMGTLFVTIEIYPALMGQAVVGVMSLLIYFTGAYLIWKFGLQALQSSSTFNHTFFDEDIIGGNVNETEVEYLIAVTETKPTKWNCSKLNFWDHIGKRMD